LHVFVIVWNVEDRDLFVAEGVSEFSVQALAVYGFHDNDEIGPFELLFSEGDKGIVVESGGIDIDAGVVGKNGLGSGAAELVLGTKEENVFHSLR